MSCTALQTELNELRADRRAQEDLLEHLQGAGLEVATEQLGRIEADIAETEAALDLCLAQEAQEENPVPQRITASVTQLRCHDASAEALHDEPYVLVAAFDMTRSLSGGVVTVTLPAVNVVKVGPWSGVDGDETHYASHLTSSLHPPFWDLDGEASPIATSQNVIFLVAMMEHDGSSPDNIRGAVRTELLAARLQNVGRSYGSYVTNMISNMTGTIDTSRLIPGNPSLNFDDLIGTVQQLNLTTSELATLNNNLLPVTKTLRFTSRKANGTVTNDYTVTFSFTVDR